ncbi:hypothetical protein P3547_25290, partial [Vibrio parahaemolyticus]|nr:hypothetical protein [Vibrio parahaemolyticus]
RINIELRCRSQNSLIFSAFWYIINGFNHKGLAGLCQVFVRDQTSKIGIERYCTTNLIHNKPQFPHVVME